MIHGQSHTSRSLTCDCDDTDEIQSLLLLCLIIEYLEIIIRSKIWVCFMQLVSGVVSTDSYTSTYNSYKPEIFFNCYGLIV